MMDEKPKRIRMDKRRWELLAKHGDWEHWHAIYCPNDHLVRNTKTKESFSVFGFWGQTTFHQRAFNHDAYACPRGCPHRRKDAKQT